MSQHKNHGGAHRPPPQGQGSRQEEVRLPPVAYEVGHNGTHVFVLFQERARGMALDDAGYEKFIAGLAEVKADLDKARAKAANG